MITPLTTWHGYPNAAVITCDQCGATISEGTNPENAEERTPKEAILVRRVIITKQGAKHYDRDFCRFTCQCKYNLENYGGVAA